MSVKGQVIKFAKICLATVISIQFVCDTLSGVDVQFYIIVARFVEF